MDIERTGAKPELVEIGPFTYRSKWHKTDVKHHQNGTVSYKEMKTYHFVRELSISNESDIITTLNGPLAITLSLLQNAPSAVRVVVTLALDAVSEGFFIKRTIKQLLFEGYPDLLTSFGPLLNSKIPTNNNGKFAWLYGRNASDDGLFSVYTGKDNIERLNMIDKYKGMNSLNHWAEGSECNALNGSTNAEIFPPIKEGESLYLFHPDFCRRWKLQFKGKIQINGITAYAYSPDSNTFKNGIDYPPNSCFISLLPNTPSPTILSFGSRSNFVKQRKIRFNSGVFDLSACKYGAPVLMSFPHFLNADPIYLSSIDGLQPNESKHEFHMAIEPITGTSVETAARIQINVFINKPPGLFRYRNIPEIVFPVFWQELSVDLTNNFANHIKWVIKQPSLISLISSSSMLVIGLLLVFTSLLFPLYNHFKHMKSKTEGSVCQSDKTDNSQVIIKILLLEILSLEQKSFNLIDFYYY
jgi:hypothetical protein